MTDSVIASARAARTKIVATIGPASAAPEQVDALLDAGLSVARVNCAHGTPESRATLIATLRARAAAKGLPLAILADLGGPKLRVGTFAGGSVQLLRGNAFTLTTAEIVGDATRVSVNHLGLPGDVRQGNAIYLNDGLIQLTVTGVSGADIHTVVEVGGWLSDKKGLSVPAAAISTPSLTAKDWHDLDHLAAHPVDYVSLSFVRSADDIALLREGMTARGMALPIVAKIEKAQAVERLDEIVAAADAIMVARGDLGVEMPIEDVPTLQKRIILACNQAAKPVITATQMLESMVANPRPTRAEASDVANAVLDGTDAVMLSAETATGQYPIEAVRIMRRIIVNAEGFLRRPAPAPAAAGVTIGDAVGRSACLAAESLGAGAIVCLTQSGATARYLARWRPHQPIYGVTPHAETWRRLNLVWGVEPIAANVFDTDFDDGCAQIVARLRARGTWPPGTAIAITAGLPFSARGRTNTVRIETL